MSEASELLDRLLHTGDPEDAMADAIEYLLRQQIDREKSRAVLQAMPPFAPTPEREQDTFGGPRPRP